MAGVRVFRIRDYHQRSRSRIPRAVSLTNGRFAPEPAAHPESLLLQSDNKKQKATRAFHRMAFARLSPVILSRSAQCAPHKLPLSPKRIWSGRTQLLLLPAISGIILPLYNRCTGVPPTGVNKDQRLHLLTIVDFRLPTPRCVVNTWTARVSLAEDASTLRGQFWHSGILASLTSPASSTNRAYGRNPSNSERARNRRRISKQERRR